MKDTRAHNAAVGPSNNSKGAIHRSTYANNVSAALKKLLLLFIVIILNMMTTVAYTPDNTNGGKKLPIVPPFLRKVDMVGVWKLTKGTSLLPKVQNEDMNFIQNENKRENQSSSNNADILIRINIDGSFDIYGSSSSSSSGGETRTEEEKPMGGSHDELRLILERGGNWDYEDQDKILTLAPDRPIGANSKMIHDTVLIGKVQASITQSMPEQQQQYHEQSTVLPDEEGQQQQQKEGETNVIASTVNSPKNYSKSNVTSSNAETTNRGTNTSKDQINIQQRQSSKEALPLKQQYDVHLSIPKGERYIGKFMYPKKHNAFFQQPMLLHQTSIGNFKLHQVLGNLKVQQQLDKNSKTKEKEKNITEFHKKDFYNKTFILTYEPLPVNEQYAKADKHYNSDKDLHEIYILPKITFHSNNTFTAIGHEKYLRGRYGISGEQKDKLWFQVSLFGAGRSAPGSVYSEGPNLSHNDRRGYLGTIQKYNVTSTTQDSSTANDDHKYPDMNNNHTNQTKFFVQGNTYYGNDLNVYGRFRPSPMGTFSMQEITSFSNEDSGAEKKEDEQDEYDDYAEEEGSHEDDDNLPGIYVTGNNSFQ